MDQPRFQTEVFGTSFTLNNGSAESINLTTIISNHEVAKTCVGHVNFTSCLYISAVGEYSVVLEQDELKLEEPVDPKIIARANNTAITPKAAFYSGESDPNDVYSTLAGIVYGANVNFLWNEKMIVMPGFQSTAPVLIPEIPPGAIPYLDNTDTWGRQRGKSDCAPSWKDPRDDIVSSMNKLMFRTGVEYAQIPETFHGRTHMDPGLEARQVVTARRVDKITVFSSNFDYFAGAATIEIFTILIVLYSFYGWWRLGRNPSLSPLEIAKAFDAPLLADVPSNCNGRQLAKLVGEQKVQYGIINDVTEAKTAISVKAEKLVITSESVRNPSGKSLGLQGLLHLLEMPLTNHRGGR